jgi:hypothetical protein
MAFGALRLELEAKELDAEISRLNDTVQPQEGRHGRGI